MINMCLLYSVLFITHIIRTWNKNPYNGEDIAYYLSDVAFTAFALALLFVLLEALFSLECRRWATLKQ